MPQNDAKLKRFHSYIDLLILCRLKIGLKQGTHLVWQTKRFSKATSLKRLVSQTKRFSNIFQMHLVYFMFYLVKYAVPPLASIKLC